MTALALRAQPFCLGALFFACALGEGITQAMLGVLAGVCVLGQPRGWLRTPVAKLTIGLVGWSVVSMLTSRHGFPRSSDAARLINYAPLILVPVALGGRAKPERVLWPLVVGLGLASVYAFFQYRFGVTIGAKLSGAAMERWQELAPGFTEGPDERYVAGGFLYHRLKFANALVFGLLAAVFVLDRYRWPMVALLLCGLWLTFARAAFVAFVIAALVTMLIEWRARLKDRIGPRIKWGALLLFVPVAIAASMPSVLTRLGSLGSRTSYSDRAFIWERAIAMIKDHPWFGVGYGNYARVCNAYYDAIDPSFVMRSQAHNQFLTFWTETGPVGAILFAALMVAAWVQARKQPDPRLRAYSTGSVLATLLLCLMHDPFFHGVTCILLCSCLAMGLARKPAE